MKVLIFLVLALVFSSCGEDSDGEKSMVGGEGGNNGSSSGDCEVDEDCKVEEWPYLTGNNGVRCEAAPGGFAKRCSECSEEFPCPEGYYCAFSLACYPDDP